MVFPLIWLLPLLAGNDLPGWTAVADHLIETPVESYPFDWGEGVQMMGLVKAAAVRHDARYLDYVERWARIYEAKDVKTLLNIGPVSAPRDHFGYSGHWSPGSAVLYLYHERGDSEHLKLAREVMEFVAAGAERSSEGALGHWQGVHQLWVDTLFMACPLLAGMGHAQDAANQIVLFSQHLQDEKTGLFYHMWDWQTGARSEGFWGRGNGWVLMSIADTLEAMKPGDASYELQKIAQNLVRGLSSTQDSDGLWHTVLDDRSSYAECSATAMFSYGLLKLVRLHVLPETDRRMALTAWRAINQKYVRDGVVTGVSGGTGPRGINAYLKIPVGSQTWGTGAYLLAASEVSRAGGKVR